MKTPDPPPITGAFSRLSLYLFIFLVPACFLVIVLTILLVQYRSFKAMVVDHSEIREWSMTEAQKKQLDSLSQTLQNFAKGDSLVSDSLWFGPADLELMIATSSITIAQHLRFKIEIPSDTLFVLRSSQSVQDLNGSMAWIFKKISPHGFLNARIDGIPQLDTNGLQILPVRGFINGQTVPRTSLSRRGGTSPGDFMEPNNASYQRFVKALKEVKLRQGKVLLIRKTL